MLAYPNNRCLLACTMLSLTLLNCSLSPASSLAKLVQDEVIHTKDSKEQIVENLKEGKAVLVDVREKSEWNAGHLRGAKLIPWSKLRLVSDRKNLKELPDDELIVYCYCKAGVRAFRAAKKLEAMGYDVRPIKAGFKELVKEGFESEK